MNQHNARTQLAKLLARLAYNQLKQHMVATSQSSTEQKAA